MSNLSEASKCDCEEQVKLLSGLRNPVLRTYLFPADHKSWKRYLLLLASVVGVSGVVLGPIIGVLLIPRCLRQEAIQRQNIAPGDACYEAKKVTHECPHTLRVEYTLFNLTNPEDFTMGSSPPLLREVGPFVFTGTEVSQAVTFTSNMESVEKGFSIKQVLSQDDSCSDCDLDQKIMFLNKEYLNNSDPGVDLIVETTVRAVIWAIASSSQGLVYALPSNPPNDEAFSSIPLNMHYKKLYTGWKDHKQATHVIEYEEVEVLKPHGFDDGQVFGPGFSAKDAQVVFDSWVAQPAPVNSTGVRPTSNSIKSHEMTLDTNLLCPDNSNLQPCLRASWNVSHRFNVPTIVTLPFFAGVDEAQMPKWLSSAAEEDRTRHRWHFHVEPSSGITVSRQTTYQISHFATSDSKYPGLWSPPGFSGIWLPTHWIRVVYGVSSSDLNFLKSASRKLTLGYYLCGIAFPVLGACLLMYNMHAFFFSNAARARYKIMQIMLRSRARDPKLTPGQYNALKHFMTSQMKRPRRTKRTDEVGDLQKTKPNAGKLQKDSAQGKKRGENIATKSKLSAEQGRSSPGTSGSH